MPGTDGFERRLPDDGLYTPEIKLHTLEKIRLHNAYAGLFTTSMHRTWPQLAYVGLYSGSGRARLAGTGEIVETTAMGVFRIDNPFTTYIFVDSDTRCVDALRARIATVNRNADVSIINGDANRVVESVRDALPPFEKGHGLLSFCFMDPFAANLQFEVIRNLCRHRMDFLILLMVGRDLRTNLTQYYSDPSSTRVADLIDDKEWRSAFKARSDRNIVLFVLERFDAAMVRLGYRSAGEDLRRQVTAAGTGVLQYVLVFYSRNELGQRFWKAILRSAGEQRSFDLG